MTPETIDLFIIQTALLALACVIAFYAHEPL